MIKPTHFIEVYRNSDGEVKTSMIVPITWVPLGMKIKNWETLRIIKIRLHENDTKRSQNKKS